MYRSIANTNQPLLQQPVRWARSLPAFQALATNPTPPIAAALAAASVADVDKVWTELAYESARVQVAPEMPSRLDALYAYADPLEALSFTEVTGEPKQVWEGNVQDRVPWAVVDMSAFKMVEPTNADEAGYQEAWDRAFEEAKMYWEPGDEVRIAEVLVAGSVLLSRRLELIPLLRELGLVERSTA